MADRFRRSVPIFLALLVGLVGTLPAEVTDPADEPRFDPALFESLHWRNIGPFRGGRSTAVAGVVQDPRTFFMGTVGGGLWRTTDAGTSWHNVSDGHFATGSVGAVAVAPSDPNVVWVGMGESCARGVMTTHGDGVYRSTDGGTTWTHLGLAESRHIAEIEIHPDDPDVAWVAVQGHLWGPNDERGVFKTTDGGATWTKTLFVDDTTGAADLSLDPSNPRVLYAAMWQHRRYPWTIESGGPGSGIYQSTDGGETWEERTEGLPETMGKIGVAVSPADGRRVWAIVEAEKGGLYRSDDAGKTWTLVNDERRIQTRSWYYMHVFAHPMDRHVVWVLNAPAFRSIDGGRTFEVVRTPHGDNHDMWIHPTQPTTLINANDGGANVSVNDGATWSTQTNQPTAQFYRVIADRRFPYWIYGGQQDNSAIAIMGRSLEATIHERHWHDISGCETADPAFDRDAPRYIYGGCYQGLISEYDLETGRDRSVMAYPSLNLSAEPRSMRYRFNWNAPILVSEHDPAVIYHAANVVLKSTDRGVRWQELSPDLTRDEDDKQGPGGGPITSEGAGGEVYNTILAFAESPHDADVLWVGADDGLVHRTGDGGATWDDVTPPSLRDTPAMINTIEPSPHDPATAYLAVTRYKWDDLRPEVYKTADHGATWVDLATGLPADTIVRAVREDPARAGLLYAGTENGLFVSWDDGERWQNLQLDLPVVAITDLEVVDLGDGRGADLVVATHGRSFWILDDLTPIRAMNDEIGAAALHLFSPRPAHLMPGPIVPPKVPGRGENASVGLVLHYLIGETPSADAVDAGDGEPAEETEGDEDGQSEKAEPSALVIEIFDAAGELVRRAASDDAGDGAPSVEPGSHRWIWNLTGQLPARMEGATVFGDPGLEVGPGSYRVRLSHGEVTAEHEVEVRVDPRGELTIEDYRPRQDLLATVRERLHAIWDAANRLADTKQQIEAYVGRLEDRDDEAATVIRDAGEALVERIDALDEVLVQRKTRNFQDIINYPNQLDADYAFLMGSVNAGPPVNAGDRDRLADLDVRWAEHRVEIDAIFGEALGEWNALVDEHAVPTVIAPEPATLFPADDESAAGDVSDDGPTL
ncbi:MAG: glycosyl hydrolase [Acidobacteriota bacterium]